MQGPGTEKQARVSFIIILCIFASLIMFGIVSCCDDKSSNNKSVYKYALGDIVWIKPDSLKVTISNRYYYGDNDNGDNGVRYEIEYFGPNGHKETETIKEFQIFGKKY